MCRLREADMFREARARHRGLIWILELLVFAAVFYVASMVESILPSIAMMVSVFRDPSFYEAMHEVAGTGDFAGIYNTVMAIVTNQPVWMTLLSLFCTVLLTVVVLLFCKVIQKRTIASVGFRRSGAVKEYLVGAGFGTAMILLTALLGILAGGYRISPSEDCNAMILVYLAGYLLQGMSEEVLCRGYFMPSFARRHPLWLAIVLNSLIFSLLHIANPGFGIMPLISIFLMGVVFSLYVVKRGNLWGACALHSLWNFVQGNILGISVSGTGIAPSLFRMEQTGAGRFLTGGTFGIEGSIVTCVVEIAAILVIWFLVPEKKDEFKGAQAEAAVALQ